METYTVRSRDRVLATYHTLAGAERYYLICGCHRDPSIYITKGW